MTKLILIQDFFKDESSTEQMDKKLQSLKSPAANFPLVYQLQQYINQIKASDEGSVAPFFQAKDTKNKDIRVYDYRGKYVILSFTSNDCELCEKNTQDLASIYKKYKDKQFDILSVVIPPSSLGPQKPKLSGKNLTKISWKTIPLKDNWSAKIIADYNVSELPLNILIDTEGKIIVRESSANAIGEKLEKLLPNP